MDQEVEVLHLSVERMEEGIVYLREVSFGSDHKTYVRLSRREDDTECPWETQGWREKGVWDTLEQLEKIVEENRDVGFKVEWHPFYNRNLNEFRKNVSWK